MNIIPTKTPFTTVPSEAIRQALADLADIENDPRYAVDMGSWHTPGRDTGVCQVCMAGAILAKRVNDPTELAAIGVNSLTGISRAEMDDGQYSDACDEVERVEAFDYLRDGSIASFLRSYISTLKGIQLTNAFFEHLNGDNPDGLDTFDECNWLTDYDIDRVDFKLGLHALADFLETQGH